MLVLKLPGKKAVRKSINKVKTDDLVMDETLQANIRSLMEVIARSAIVAMRSREHLFAMIRAVNFYLRSLYPVPPLEMYLVSYSLIERCLKQLFADFSEEKDPFIREYGLGEIESSISSFKASMTSVYDDIHDQQPA